MPHHPKGSAAAKAWGAKMKKLREAKNGGPITKATNYYGNYFSSTGLGYGRKRAPKGMGKPKRIPGSGPSGMTRAQYIHSDYAKENLAAGRAKRKSMGSRAGYPYVMRKCRREAQEIVNSLNHAKFKTAAQWKRGVNQMLGRHSRFGYVSPHFGTEHRRASIAAFNSGHVKRPSLPLLPQIPSYADVMSDSYVGKMSGMKHTAEEFSSKPSSTGSFKRKKVYYSKV